MLVIDMHLQVYYDTKRPMHLSVATIVQVLLPFSIGSSEW